MIRCQLLLDLMPSFIQSSISGLERRTNVAVVEIGRFVTFPGPETIPKVVVFPSVSVYVKGPKYIIIVFVISTQWNISYILEQMYILEHQHSTNILPPLSPLKPLFLGSLSSPTQRISFLHSSGSVTRLHFSISRQPCFTAQRIWGSLDGVNGSLPHPLKIRLLPGGQSWLGSGKDASCTLSFKTASCSRNIRPMSFKYPHGPPAK